MARARRVCSVAGCPQLTDTGRCTEHRREADQQRGTKQQRGYDRDHDRLRRRLAPRVATGTVRCWRCQELIAAGEPWDLGHLDDRRLYGGPEHVVCNRAAAGRAAHPALPQGPTEGHGG